MIVGCDRAVFRRPSLLGPAAFKLGSHVRSLELHRNQTGRDGGARRGSPFPLHGHAASGDAVPTNVPREMRAKVMNA